MADTQLSRASMSFFSSPGSGISTLAAAAWSCPGSQVEHFVIPASNASQSCDVMSEIVMICWVWTPVENARQLFQAILLPALAPRLRAANRRERSPPSRKQSAVRS